MSSEVSRWRDKERARRFRSAQVASRERVKSVVGACRQGVGGLARLRGFEQGKADLASLAGDI